MIHGIKKYEIEEILMVVKEEAITLEVQYMNTMLNLKLYSSLYITNLI